MQINKINKYRYNPNICNIKSMFHFYDYQFVYKIVLKRTKIVYCNLELAINK